MTIRIPYRRLSLRCVLGYVTLLGLLLLGLFQVGLISTIKTKVRSTNFKVHEKLSRDHEEELSRARFDAANIEYDLMMKAEQNRRFQILKNGCEKLNISRSLPDLSDQYLGHLIVDCNYKILFNFIPKVSCMMWKNLFTQLKGPYGHRLLREFKTESQRLEWLQKCRKAVFVREPLTRLLSMYLDKFCNYGTDQRGWERVFGRKIVKEYRQDHSLPQNIIHKDDKESPFLNITFTEFIQFMIDNNHSFHMNSITDHFLPQSSVASPCAIHYDFIGHFENVSTEASHMLKFLDILGIVQYPGFHASEAETNFVKEYRKVPLELLYKLEEFYHADYELFGYSFNDTLRRIITGKSETVA